MIVDALYDLLCPWSLVAKRHFDIAVERTRPTTLQVRWRPFMLYPHFDRAGHDFLGFFRERYGEAPRVPMWDRIRGVAEPIGIHFAFERITRGPASIDTHRIVRLASREVPGREGALYEAVARAFFEQARVIDVDLLIEKAAEAGIAPDRARAYLESDEDEAAIFAETEAWRAAGVTSMPHYIIDDGRGRVTTVKQTSPLAFARLLARA
ncbi:MAG TPA: DsbA family protein [Sphingomonas sp.]|jgi:predicted DsbA family dithiol-disulfide isomerase